MQHISRTILGVLTLSQLAFAQFPPFVSPQDQQALEGSASTNLPLGRANARFQQLYSDLGPAAPFIGHAYRRDAISTRGTVAAFKSDMSLALSVSPLTPASASTTFAQNAGANPTQVLPGSKIDFVATQRPGQGPAVQFELRVPYTTPYIWAGKGVLCLDMTIYGNETSAGNNRNFSPLLDAQELFASGLSKMPGYSFGQGCSTDGLSSAASASLEVQRRGNSLDLDILAKNGFANGHSALLFGNNAASRPWIPGSACTLYSSSDYLMLLPGSNDAQGQWSGKVPMGLAPPAGFAMWAQIASCDPNCQALVLSQGMHMVAPAVGPGLTGVRIANSSDRSAATGTRSHSVPVTEFY